MRCVGVVWLWLVVLASQVGCSPPETEQEAIERERAEEAGQVVARIDGEPLTLGQFEATIDEQPVFIRRSLRGETARLRHFGNWIDFLLLVREAERERLGTDPVAQQAVREQLARLFWADPGLWSTAGELGEAEIAAWFEAHREDYRAPARLDVLAVHRGSPERAERLVLALQVGRTMAHAAGAPELSASEAFATLASRLAEASDAQVIDGEIDLGVRASDEASTAQLRAAALAEALAETPVPTAAPAVAALADGTAFVYISRQRIEPAEPSLRSVRNRVVQDLLAARARQAREDRVEHWLREADVRILDPEYRALEDLLAGTPHEDAP